MLVLRPKAVRKRVAKPPRAKVDQMPILLLTYPDGKTVVQAEVRSMSVEQPRSIERSYTGSPFVVTEPTRMTMEVVGTMTYHLVKRGFRTKLRALLKGQKPKRKTRVKTKRRKP